MHPTSIGSLCKTPIVREEVRRAGFKFMIFCTRYRRNLNATAYSSIQMRYRDGLNATAYSRICLKDDQLRAS
jgi:hypothetical protein